MKAALYYRFGPPEVVELRDVEKPAVPDDGVLVRVRASSVNPADWYPMMGRPYIARATFGIRKPKESRLGIDYAGTVESVGKSVTRFRPGDEVFGGRTGALAEFLCLPESGAIAVKPVNVTFEAAAATPVAGVTALQALRDRAQIKPGQHVLINGASGGVGTFAVQVAKVFGADVTAVCSTGNVEMVRSLGADAVIDYTRDDFTRSGQRYDAMIDIAGSRPWSACRRVLEPNAAYVIVGGPKKNRMLGPFSRTIKVRVGSMRASQKVVSFFLAQLNQPDLEVLSEMLGTGKIKPVVEKCYPLSDVREAFRHLGDGHARGKLVITM